MLTLEGLILKEFKDTEYNLLLNKMFELLKDGKDWVTICRETFGYEKWEKVTDNILVPLCNKNIIKKVDKVSWALSLGYFLNSNKSLNLDLNSSIKCYRGFPKERKENNLEKFKNSGLLSFSLDKETAKRFTDLSYTSGNFKVDRKYKGYIAEIDIKVKDVYLFNSYGYENELIISSPLTKYKLIEM